MKRRTLIKLSSLFSVASIFSASVSIVENKRVSAQQFRRVGPSSSSCARQIDAVFRHYKLKVKSFDIRFADSSGNYYQYASNGTSSKSTKKIDQQPDELSSPISLYTDPNFDGSKRIVAQRQPLKVQVLNGIQTAMKKEGTTLLSAGLSAIGPNGEPCDLNPYTPSSTYAPGP